MRGPEAYPRNASPKIETREGGIMQRMTSFTWRDGERTIRFGRGVAATAVEALGGPGYVLLTTPRAARQLPAVADAAARVVFVPGGQVPALAAGAMEEAAGHDRIVALGGGRIVDTDKAVTAALRVGHERARATTGHDVAGAHGARAMAIPTTLSGAEMTRGHRHAEGVDEAVPRVRCAVVVFDPALAASQPVPELAASALNALAHAVEAPCTVARNPVATLAARDAARQIVGAFAGDEPDRDELALGALLAGYTIDSAGFGLHHVMAQTLVRQGIASHGAANAIMLPHTIPALARRAGEEHAALAAALGEDPAAAAARICALTGATRLRDVGATVLDLDACARVAAARRELDNTPPRAHPTELRALYAAAW
jgi:alcohol dehydrogenase class IV